MKKLLLICGALFTILSAGAQTVTTYAGASDSGYSASGTALSKAKFYHPYGVAYDGKGNVYVTDYDNSLLVSVNNSNYYIRSGAVTGGYQDGSGAGNGLFTNPAGIAVSTTDQSIYFCDQGNSAIRKLAPFVAIGQSQGLTTVAGGGPFGNGVGVQGYTEAKGQSARFSNPVGLAYVKSGDYLLVADRDNSVIRKVDVSSANFGQTSLYAGIPNQPGKDDGAAIGTATFNSPSGIYLDPYTGDVYVTEFGGSLRKISGSTVSTVMADTLFTTYPSAICRGPNSELYVSDGNYIIQYSLTSKKYHAFAGSTTAQGFKDGVGYKALFNFISSFTLTPDAKSIYVTDNNSIRMVTTSAFVDIAPVSPLEDQIGVYPNPAHNFINVSSTKNDHAVLTLMDISGRLLFRKDMQLAKGTGNQLDISSQAKGIYLLNISTKAGSITKRIVISE